MNPLVPFDASGATARGRLTVAKLNHGGLPLVLAQTFRAIIHSRMKVGMEKYHRQYPGADIMLFEPDREDADMFFANIFSYTQRKRLCAAAFATTRYNLRVRAPTLAPRLARHGITIRTDRLADSTRDLRAALTDPRAIRSDPRARPSVRGAARDLGRTLEALERWIARAGRRPRR